MLPKLHPRMVIFVPPLDGPNLLQCRRYYIYDNQEFYVIIQQWYSMVWYGMVWYGMVWYGMVRCDTVRYGMLCYAMLWQGMLWQGMLWQ